MNTEQLTPQIIGRTNLERVDNFHVRETYAALLGDVAPTDLAAVVAGLEQHFARREHGALLECTVCGGWSDDSVDVCAFCGEGEVETREVATHPLAPVEVEPAQPKAVALVKRDATDTKAIELFRRSGAGTTEELATSIATLPAGEEGALAFAAAFNTKVATTLRRAAVDLYDRGAELNAAHEARLHERLGLTWEGFLDEHFDLPRTTAFKLQRNAELFTREQIQTLGSKADELAPLSPEQRAKLLPEASKMSFRALRAAVAQVRSPAPSTLVKSGKEAPGISLGLHATSAEIPLLRLGEDAAVGVLACTNGRALQIALARNADGALIAHVRPVGGA